MLEFLRRQTKPIMISLAAIIILAFTFWGGQTQPKDPGMHSAEDTAFTIYGKEHTFAEHSRLERLYRLAYGLGLSSPTGRGDFASTMGFVVQKYQAEGMIPVDFAFNLLVLREELEKNGVRATNEEAREAFRKLPIFQSKEGSFDGNVAEQFQNNIGALGLRDSDVFDVLRDWIGFKRLHEIVAGNAVLNNNVSKQLYASTFQTVKAASIPFVTDEFKKDAKPTDEEIAKYYEEQKETFKTAPKRAISYVLFPKPDVEKLNAEDTVKARNEYAARVNDFGVAAIAPGAKLEEVAKNAKAELKTEPLFTREAPPEALKEEFALITEIFRIDPKNRPVSDPVEGTKGYYFFSVTQEEEPKQQELAEVKEKITEQLTTQKAQELMTKAATEARKKLEEAIKGGKSFADAAKEANLAPQDLPEFSPSNPLMDRTNGREIAAETRTTPAGSFTKPLPTENGVLLVYVISKELRKREDGATTKENIEKSLDGMMQGDIFRAWFQRRREEAKENADPLQRRIMGIQ